VYWESELLCSAFQKRCQFWKFVGMSCCCCVDLMIIDGRFFFCLFFSNEEVVDTHWLITICWCCLYCYSVCFCFLIIGLLLCKKIVVCRWCINYILCMVCGLTVQVYLDWIGLMAIGISRPNAFKTEIIISSPASNFFLISSNKSWLWLQWRSSRMSPPSSMRLK